MFHEAEVVSVVPDLGDLSALVEPVDVHSGERGRLSGWLNVTPLAGERPGRRPTRRDKVVFAKHEVDTPAGIREGSAEVSRDFRHTRRTRKRMCGTEVVPDVVVREHVACKLISAENDT